MIFDRALLQLRQQRINACFSEYNYLLKYAEENIIHKLSFIKKPFNRVLIIGRHTPSLINALKHRESPPQLIIKCGYPSEDRSFEEELLIKINEESLPFQWPSFDLIYMPLVIHHLNDVPGVLWQICQTLYPDGLFLSSFFGGQTLSELRQAFFAAEIHLKGGASPRISPFMSLSTAASLLNRAGFTLPVADREIITVTFSDAYHLMADLRGMGETNVLSSRTKYFTPRTLFEHMAAFYRQNFQTSDDRIRATFELFYLTGWSSHPDQPKPLARGSANLSLGAALTGQRE